MINVDVSDKLYGKYITLKCDEASIGEAIEAIEYQWDKPEGKRKIFNTYRDKGEPLEIFCSSKVISNTYGYPEWYTEDLTKEERDKRADEEWTELEHRIMLNPVKIKTMSYEDEDGHTQFHTLNEYWHMKRFTQAILI